MPLDFSPIAFGFGYDILYGFNFSRRTYYEDCIGKNVAL
jgi:hypothetical protein